MEKRVGHWKVTYEKKVFLDANSIISSGKPPGGPSFSKLAELSSLDLVDLFTVDIVCWEVARFFARKEFEKIQVIANSAFRKYFKERTGISIDAISNENLYRELVEKYRKRVDEMMKCASCRIIPCEKADTQQVMKEYFFEEGLFSRHSKKEQIRDAFILSAIHGEIEGSLSVVFTSADKDFRFPLSNRDGVTTAETIEKALEQIGNLVGVPSSDVQYLIDNQHEISELISSEFLEGGLLITDPEDSYIESVSIPAIQFTSVKEFNFSQDGGSRLFLVEVAADVCVEYTHPDWEMAMYDSEDKRLIPFETVFGESVVDVNLTVSINLEVGDDGKIDGIRGVSKVGASTMYIDFSGEHDMFN